MSNIKTTTGLLLFAKNETSYGAGAAMASTNVIQVSGELPIFQQQYSHTGERGMAQWSGGNLRRSQPGGKTATGNVKIELKGLGATYTTASTPPNAHAFLLASGLTGSLSASGWLYTPRSIESTPVSLALSVIDRGEQLPVSGAYCTMTVTCDGPSPSILEFGVQGMTGEIEDISNPPARSFVAHDVLPPKNEGINCVIDGYTARVRSYTLDTGQQISPRLNLSAAGGHSGFTLGGRQAVLNITIEAEALSTFDPYDLWQSGSVISTSWTVGNVANNRVRFTIPNGQITSVNRANDEDTAIWELQISPSVSAPDMNDEFSIYYF